MLESAGLLGGVLLNTISIYEKGEIYFKTFDIIYGEGKAWAEDQNGMV